MIEGNLVEKAQPMVTLQKIILRSVTYVATDCFGSVGRRNLKISHDTKGFFPIKIPSFFPRNFLKISSVFL